MTNEEAKVFLDNLKICIDEHPIVADWLVEIADRKTEPTISKMEQVDKDINVRSKDEPQTNADQHAQHIGSVESVEPTWTKEEHEAFYTFLWNAINPNEMQDYIEMFETKDDPQTEDEILREQCRAFMGIVEQTRREGE